MSNFLKKSKYFEKVQNCNAKILDVVFPMTPTPLISYNIVIWRPPPPLKRSDVFYGRPPMIIKWSCVQQVNKKYVNVSLLWQVGSTEKQFELSPTYLPYESSILGQLLIWIHKRVLDGNPYSFMYSNSRTHLCMYSNFRVRDGLYSFMYSNSCTHLCTQISEYGFWGKSPKFSKCQNL